MEKQGYRIVMILIVFVWAGMVIGISFVEAPLKFQAPNVTLAIGVGIGRLVFGVLNKLEIVYCSALILLTIITRPSSELKAVIGVVAGILILQSIWLLPELDARAQIVINGGASPEKSPHIYYVIGEAIKIFALIFIGIRLFNESIRRAQKSVI